MPSPCAARLLPANRSSVCPPPASPAAANQSFVSPDAVQLSALCPVPANQWSVNPLAVSQRAPHLAAVHLSALWAIAVRLFAVTPVLVSHLARSPASASQLPVRLWSVSPSAFALSAASRALAGHRVSPALANSPLVVCPASANPSALSPAPAYQVSVCPLHANLPATSSSAISPSAMSLFPAHLPPASLPAATQGLLPLSAANQLALGLSTYPAPANSLARLWFPTAQFTAQSTLDPSATGTHI